MPEKSFTGTAAVLLAVAAALASTTRAFAWGDGGHMIVARIAYTRLTPQVRAQVDRLLALPIAPAETSKATGDFVHAAIWADEVRGQPGFENTADLHYVDNPFSEDGTKLPTDLPKPQNIVTGLRDEVNVLRSKTAKPADQAQALRFLIHFVGDIHQPLHCATRVSPLYPDGDRGGNDFSIALPGSSGDDSKSRVKLHSYWDEGLRTFPYASGGPPTVTTVNAAAAHFTAEDPDTDNGWRQGGPFNYIGWMGESEWLARNFVYTGLKRGRVPSAQYVQEGTRIARKRVTWAGYRLAAMLNTLLGTH